MSAAAHTDSFLERAPLLARDFITGRLPEPARWTANTLITIALLLAAFGLLFAFLTLAERKILGRVQNRPGPNRTGWFGLLQPFADGVKMLTKEDLVPRASDQVLHYLAPVALLSLSIITFAVIPYGRHMVPVDLDAGVLYFFAAGSATELSIFMAGWASHNKYALLAAMRALAQLISYELPLLLSVVPVVLAAGTLSTSGIVDAQHGWAWGVVPRWNVFTPWGAAGFAIFFVSSLAESNRSPFDLPEAESELIAGHLTEYSGFKYALFFMAEYFGMCALSGMGVTLFLGGWRSPLAALEFIPSYGWFTLKLLALLGCFIWIRATLPRLRIDQLTRLAWKFLVPLALVNLGMAAFWALSAGWAGPLQLARWAVALAIVAVPFLLLGRREPTATRERRPRSHRPCHGRLGGRRPVAPKPAPQHPHPGRQLGGRRRVLLLGGLAVPRLCAGAGLPGRHLDGRPVRSALDAPLPRRRGGRLLAPARRLRHFDRDRRGRGAARRRGPHAAHREALGAPAPFGARTRVHAHGLPCRGAPGGWRPPDGGPDRGRGAGRGRPARPKGGRTMSPLQLCLAFSSVLFAVGLAGALARSNAILVLLGLELMLNAANLNFIAFWRYGPASTPATGVVFVLFSIAVAAAEAAVGLALVIALYRRQKNIRLPEATHLKG